MIWLFGGLGAVIVVVVGIGAALPRDHQVSAKAVIDAPIEALWARLVDPSTYPQWRRGLTRVDAQSGPPRRWVEHAGRRAIAYVVDEEVATTRLVSRIDDPSLPFGGSWTWQLEARGAQTVVTITERGFVKPALFRFLSRFVFGHDATIKGVLAGLAAAGVRPPPG